VKSQIIDLFRLNCSDILMEIQLSFRYRYMESNNGAPKEIPSSHDLSVCLDSEDLFFVRNTNGMASGPKKAPINAHKKVFAPLLSATNQSNIALDMNIVETNIIPII